MFLDNILESRITGLMGFWNYLSSIISYEELGGGQAILQMKPKVSGDVVLPVQKLTSFK